MYHVSAELCGSHGGEVGGAGVVFAASYYCYAAHLSYGERSERYRGGTMEGYLCGICRA